MIETKGRLWQHRSAGRLHVWPFTLTHAVEPAIDAFTVGGALGALFNRNTFALEKEINAIDRLHTAVFARSPSVH